VLDVIGMTQAEFLALIESRRPRPTARLIEGISSPLRTDTYGR